MALFGLDDAPGACAASDSASVELSTSTSNPPSARSHPTGHRHVQGVSVELSFLDVVWSQYGSNLTADLWNSSGLPVAHLPHFLLLQDLPPQLNVKR